MIKSQVEGAHAAGFAAPVGAVHHLLADVRGLLPLVWLQRFPFGLSTVVSSNPYSLGLSFPGFTPGLSFSWVSYQRHWLRTTWWGLWKRRSTVTTRGHCPLSAFAILRRPSPL